jgi:hypothetical protein
VVNEGVGYSLEPHGTRGGLYSLMENCSSGESSVGMYKLKEAMKKFGSDLLATWRFSSHRKVMESLLVGTGY